jgi:hypothetical protein
VKLARRKKDAEVTNNQVFMVSAAPHLGKSASTKHIEAKHSTCWWK